MKKQSFIVGIVLSLSLMLTGCIDKSNSEGTSNNVVKVYNWGDYIDEDVIAQFEEETGITVIYDTFSTNEELYAKISSDPSLYDVICPSDYMIEKMIQNNLLAKINWDNVPNVKNIDPLMMKRVSDFDSNNQYTLPYTFGTVGILYNTTMVDEDITSWDVLWDETYKNNIIMQDSVRDAFAVALKKLGYSLNSTNEHELEEAKDLLRSQYPLVKAYAIDEVRDKMINGAAALGVIYSGEYLYCTEENPDLAYVVPEEGSNLWIDGWVITSGSKNKENAEKWLNFLARPDIALKNFEYITYATPNKAAQEMVDEEYLENPAVFPDEETINRCEVFHYLGQEMEDLYYEMWKLVK